MNDRSIECSPQVIRGSSRPDFPRAIILAPPLQNSMAVMSFVPFPPLPLSLTFAVFLVDRESSCQPGGGGAACAIVIGHQPTDHQGIES